MKSNVLHDISQAKSRMNSSFTLEGKQLGENQGEEEDKADWQKSAHRVRCIQIGAPDICKVRHQSPHKISEEKCYKSSLRLQVYFSPL